MNIKLLYKVLTLSCVIGIVFILLYWYSVGQPYSPSPFKERSLFMILLIVPLLVPLHGMLKNNLYTYKWASMLCCLYFVHGVMESWANPAARWLAIIELTLSLCWFIFSIAWIKAHRTEIAHLDKETKIS